LAHQGLDDALHFGRDGVAAGEFVVVEDLPEEALGEQVLHQHLIHGRARDIGVERSLAEREKLGECRLEWRVVLVRLLDFVRQAAREVGDALAELLHGNLEFADFRLGVGVEAEQQVGEVARVGEVGLHDRAAVLVEHAAAGVFENRVADGVAAADLAVDFAVQVVVRVFGFPKAPREAVGVEDRAIGADAVAAGFGAKLGHEAPSVEARGIGEEVLKGAAKAEFVLHTLIAKGGKGAVVLADQRVCGRKLGG
jgi:hypothetical protein